MEVELSIIVPVYNVEQYVVQCIESLKAQKVENFEVIIVNDGTKDSSIALCEDCIVGDERFRIVHKENGGLMSAWKEGLRHARGQYVGFVDSDDWVDADMFQVLLAQIKKYQADVVCSGYVQEYPDKHVTVTRDRLCIYEGKQVRETLISDYCCSYFRSDPKPTICRWDKIYKKDLMLKNLNFFDQRVSLAEDFNTNIAVFLDAQKVVLLPNFTPYHYRFNEKSIVNTINPKAFYNVKALEEICDTICREKNADCQYIDSFIGNVIYEEVKRICGSEIGQNEHKELTDNLEMCNASRYIYAYKKVRNNPITTVICTLIECRWFSIVHLLLSLKQQIRKFIR